MTHCDKIEKRLKELEGSVRILLEEVEKIRLLLDPPKPGQSRVVIETDFPGITI